MNHKISNKEIERIKSITEEIKSLFEFEQLPPDCYSKIIGFYNHSEIDSLFRKLKYLRNWHEQNRFESLTDTNILVFSNVFVTVGVEVQKHEFELMGDEMDGFLEALRKQHGNFDKATVLENLLQAAGTERVIRDGYYQFIRDGELVLLFEHETPEEYQDIINGFSAFPLYSDVLTMRSCSMLNDLYKLSKQKAFIELSDSEQVTRLDAYSRALELAATALQWALEYIQDQHASLKEQLSTGLRSYNKKKQHTKAEAIKLAQRIWNKDIGNKLRIGEVANEVYSELHREHKSTLPEHPATLKNWFKDAGIVPSYASRRGQPKK